MKQENKKLKAQEQEEEKQVFFSALGSS